MFKNKSNKKTSETVIRQGSRLESAKLTGSESVIIEGDYIGNVDLDADLVIGVTGSVTGSIRARQITVEGRANGNIYCDATVHLSSSAFVEGNIITKSLKTDDGAHFNGQCRMDGAALTDSGIPQPLEKEESIHFDFTKLKNVYVPDYGPPEIPLDNMEPRESTG